MEKTALFILLAILLSGCTRVQTDPGTISIVSGDSFSNTNLIFSKDIIDNCEVPKANVLSNGSISLPLNVDDIEIICVKGNQEVARRVISPYLWKTKYKNTTKNAAVTSFVTGGILGLLMTSAMTPSDPTVDDVGENFKVYPPFMAVVSRDSSDKERQEVRSSIDLVYRNYFGNLPKDCGSFNRREFHALCNQQMVTSLRSGEYEYLKKSRYSSDVQKRPASLEKFKKIIEAKIREKELANNPQ